MSDHSDGMTFVCGKTEAHDDEFDSPLGTLLYVAHNHDYVYQAEQHVIDAMTDRPTAVRWVLFNEEQIPVREWRRINGKLCDVSVTEGTTPDPRTFRSRS